VTVSAITIEARIAARVQEPQRPEERAGQTLEQEDRDGARQDDQRGVHDRRAHFERGLDDDRVGRLRAALEATLSEAPQDVLDVDDRVVNDHAEGDHAPPIPWC
jgi:hypothetical protein